MLKLNIGCGADLRKDYVNIDIHSKEEIQKRYGLEKEFIDSNIQIETFDIFNLPYEDETVDEIMCLGFLEHLSFEDEGRFFYEAKRVLKEGGLLRFTVPDFENLVLKWLKAQDNFQDFYKIGTDEHWFGNHSRTLNNRWGYLTASIFGNQDGEGQFHRNAFTVDKIKAIAKKLDFTCEIKTFNFKHTEILMLDCRARKL